MWRSGRFWFGIVKLAIWTAGVLLFFRTMAYFIGGFFVEIWVPVAGASAIFLIYFSDILKSFHLPGDAKGKQPALPTLPAGANSENAIAMIKDATTMPDKPHIYIDKVMNVNHGTINQNTPGGMMNLGPVTVHQNIGTPQSAPESAEGEPKESAAHIIGDDETIDINGLVDFSERLKSPGVARNTIDNILKRAGIKPCATEKDGRTIRNLYPREKSQAAIASYLADRDK